MLKDKIRIYVLAKELDVDCKDLIALCHRLEFDIKNQLSSLEPVQREEVETIISKGGLNTAGATGAKPSTPSVATPVAAAPSVIAPTKPPTIAKPAAVKKEPASAKPQRLPKPRKKRRTCCDMLLKSKFPLLKNLLLKNLRQLHH